jgi:nicotinic acid mononucleotide adenylyltransferase
VQNRLAEIGIFTQPVGMEPIVYDLKRLFALREALETLDLTAPPTARLCHPTAIQPLCRVGILCGSFNPLTLAHTELAERAREGYQLDSVFFTMAKVTVDKERVTGMGLEDRLLLLSLYAQRHDRHGVALVNRGLYFEQAQALRSLLGSQVELNFIVGMDKLVQILDPRYYQNRDAALGQLFALASLIVANRGDMAREAFARLLDQSENCPYRPHIRFCSLPAAIADLSATAVRNELAAGKPANPRVPRETAAFLAETHAYAPPLQRDGELIDAYNVRLKLLASLYTARLWAEQHIDLRQLMQVALSASDIGRALRSASTATDLMQRIRTSRSGFL